MTSLINVLLCLAWLRSC